MHLIHDYSNPIGVFGVLFILWVYLMIQLDKIDRENFWFSFTNFIGAFFILISLYYHPNLASIVIELAWFFISLFGLIQWKLGQREKSASESLDPWTQSLVGVVSEKLTDKEIKDGHCQDLKNKHQ